MPFVGELSDGTIVTVNDVSQDGIVTCPGCDGKMKVKKSHYNQGKKISRHFYHVEGECTAESDIHKRMKAVGEYYLTERFPEADVTQELYVQDVNRFGDVAAVFSEPRHPFGKGLIIEVQYKNKGKDISQVTTDFLTNGFSVFWAYLSDFKKQSLTEINDLELANHRTYYVWPDAIPSKQQWSGYEQPYVDEILQPDRAIAMKPPTEYMSNMACQIRSPEEIAEYTETLKRWIHSKGNELFWVSAFESDGLYDQLVANKLNKREGEHSWISLDINDPAETVLQAYGEQLDNVRQNDVDDPEFDLWWETNRSTCQMSLRTAANGAYYHQFKYMGYNGNTYSLKKKYRDGDENRFK